MVIGTLAAIGLGLAGAGTAASAIASSNASKNAAKATTQAADTSAAVIRENYDKSANALAPWQQSGLAANNQINALLGLTPTQTTQQVGPSQGQYWGPSAYGNQPVNDPGYQTPYNISTDGVQGIDPWNTQQVPWSYGQGMDPNGSGQMSLNTAISPQSAFDTYRNSTGYQFRLNQGLNAVNSGWAGKGLLQSGAALKGLNDYGQGMASNEFGNYMAALGNQQQVGFGAASAQAGVSQNMGNSLAQIAQNKGDNLANAALLSGRNTSNAFSTLAGIGGTILGGKL